jgi:hypothetical protein
LIFCIIHDALPSLWPVLYIGGPRVVKYFSDFKHLTKHALSAKNFLAQQKQSGREEVHVMRDCVVLSITFFPAYEKFTDLAFVFGLIPGLPDGILSYQKSHFGYILKNLQMENVGTFYVHLENSAAIWYNL